MLENYAILLNFKTSEKQKNLSDKERFLPLLISQNALHSAGISTFFCMACKTVAGLHRVSPSTTLDKVEIFNCSFSFNADYKVASPTLSMFSVFN